MSQGNVNEVHRLASAVAGYHAGCLRVIGAQNVAQVDVRTAKKSAAPCDIGLISPVEEVLRHGRTTLRPPEPLGDDPASREDYRRARAVWDRLCEVARTGALERHQKDVVYAGPLLHGVLPKATGSTCEPVLAPLFMRTITLAMQPDGTLDLSATDESVRFNTSVWSNAAPKAVVDQIVTLGIDAQADLAEGWDDARVDDLIAAIRAVLPAMRPGQSNDQLQEWTVRPTPAEVARSEPSLELLGGAAVYLAQKASPYLLADLDRITQDPERHVRDGRPLSVLLSPPAEEIRPELEHLDIDDVVFPFASNGPQRRVVDAVDKNRLVVVQGPPGNGKSLTIANLVAHLVADGRSVLVCSHKEQALTVVRDKLDELDLRFLYASMVGTTAIAKRELQGQIQDVRGFYGKVNQHALRKQLREVTDRRRTGGTKYRQLREEFNRRAEVEQAEAEQLLLELEPVAKFPPSDPVLRDDERERAIRELNRLNELARKHVAVWTQLCASDVASEVETGARQASLIGFLELQAARLEAAEDEHVRTLVRQWQTVAAQRPEEIGKARKAVSAVMQALEAAFAASVEDPDPTEVRAFAKVLAADPRLRADARQAHDRVEGALAVARRLQDARNLVADAATVRRQQVLMRHAELPSMFKRKGARVWLDEYAPGAAGLTADQVASWAEFWDSWQQVRDTCDALGEALRLEVPERYDPSVVSGYLARVRRAVAVADGIERARMIARTETALQIPLEEVFAALEPAVLAAQSRVWLQALSAVEADTQGNALKSDRALKWLAARVEAIDRAVDEERYEDARAGLDQLKAIRAAMPGLSERASILRGPTGMLEETIDAIEVAACEESFPPAFMRDLPAAFNAQERVKRLEEITARSSTRELAEQLSDLRSSILNDARRFLSLRIQERIYEGFRRPAFNASLERFRKAIATSAKRFDRIEELKNAADFDVDVLTEVFPCWIMRPEDACRMFPLRHDIFDVVIFDEASQCNPDQTLPIFARAKHAVVFGDENQLANEDLKRQLSSANNRTLLRRSGLEHLDPAGIFDQTENSLLGLVSHRDQSPVVLSEHFRCRPELVAFSNARFYADGLRVMRDGEDDRGLGPAIVIHELQGTPNLHKTKVNPYEAECLVNELCRLLEDPRYEGLTFGVLSLFRDQIEAIEGLVERRIPKAVRERRRLICSTVDGFQGDERDVILYSWRYSRSQSPSILAFTNGKAGDQRINVALTRARHQAIHFLSAPVSEFPSFGNVGSFLRHAENPARLVADIEARAHREPITMARRRVAEVLRSHELFVAEQFIACGTGVDVVVHDPTSWARVAVFVDGVLDPEPPPTADRRVDAHGMLERADWTVERILPQEALGDPDHLVERVLQALDRCGPRARPTSEEQRYFTHTVAIETGPGETSGDEVTFQTDIAVEDQADYAWLPPSAEARIRSGEDVFQSNFERDLHDRLARETTLQVVPQWRSRGKSIDLVVTDRHGRRLAIEADGEHHHETVNGDLIPEDIARQELLEAAGWIFHRIRHSAYMRDPDGQIGALLATLAEQPTNAALARKIWGDHDEDLERELESLREEMATSDVELPDTAGPPPEPFSISDEKSAEATTLAGKNVDVDVVPDEELAGLNHATDAEPVEVGDTASDASAIGPGRDTVDGREEPRRRATSSSPQDAALGGPVHFHDVPLAIIAVQIVELVTLVGPVAASDLVRRYGEHFGVHVPPNRHTHLLSFANSARGRKALTRDEDTYSATGELVEPFAEVGSWTIRELEQLVAQLCADGTQTSDLYERVLTIVWPSTKRVPVPIAKAVGAAIFAVVGRT